MFLFVLGLILCSKNGVQGMETNSSLQARQSTTGSAKPPAIIGIAPKRINPDCVCGKERFAPRIVDGTQVFPENNYPWMAMVKKRGKFECGGTLINDRFVLTAARCINEKDPALYEVVLGIHNITLARNSNPTDLSGQSSALMRKIIRVKVHGSFNSEKKNSPFNIGLLKFQDPVTFTNDISPICLPKYLDTFRSYGLNFNVVGWGSTERNSQYSPTLLRSKSVRVLDHRSCEWDGVRITKEEVCTKANTCIGDGGSPLFRQTNGYFTQIGIVSWGTSCSAYNQMDVLTYLPNFVRYVYIKTRGGVYCRNINAGF